MKGVTAWEIIGLGEKRPPALWNMNRYPIERVTLAELATEIPASFAFMDHGNDKPRHASSPLDCLIALLGRLETQPLGDCEEIRPARQLGYVPPLLIAAGQGGEIGHIAALRSGVESIDSFAMHLNLSRLVFVVLAQVGLVAYLIFSEMFIAAITIGVLSLVWIGFIGAAALLHFLWSPLDRS